MAQISYSKAINDALHQAMERDCKVLVYGLGVSDPKAIFGTTHGLQERFGCKRVFDMPVSENALTGLAVGVAIGGYKPVMTHQRLDFALVSIDQIVNSAAKWFYMFGGKTPIPLVIRMIIGRGWGQGPTHSQSLHSWFAHIPGLKVVMPATPYDAKGLLLESIQDPNPVIFIEHRWAHNIIGEVPEGYYQIPIGKAKVLRVGSNITIVSISFMMAEALKAAEFLSDHNISCEVIDLRTVRPIDWAAIKSSVAKTGHLVVLDIAHPTASMAAEIIAHITENIFFALKSPPKRICLPDHAVPTSQGLTQNFYPTVADIVKCIANIFKMPVEVDSLVDNLPNDVPGKWFNGPF